ncbi:nucleotidyltransferase domain-containing protein [Cytobacillus sp. IB215316]|uniref:nucleotidyltransferase domain-containing protein n=1 Tax=Cytobacillus sp. IB215316 TaxID=3097354 RepID=UPI002A0D58CC|nr:hypothetical protein [Cytobacillus sp. IB215316]MDX8361528.1 hypothetical protein [Cytobacillus sp. IB215316]
MKFEQCNRVNVLMSSYNKPWFIAGGWAIDLFIGKQTRPHDDLEIAIFRKDQLHLKDYFQDWEFNKVSNGTLYRWEKELLQLPIHEIHAEHKYNDQQQLEILLNEADNDKWLFRRDALITHPVESIWSYSASRIPFLNPQIVLLYKVKNTREKDHQDFFAALPNLNENQKEWLRHAIQIHSPEHTWLEFL